MNKLNVVLEKAIDFVKIVLCLAFIGFFVVTGMFFWSLRAGHAKSLSDGLIQCNNRNVINTRSVRGMMIQLEGLKNAKVDKITGKLQWQ